MLNITVVHTSGILFYHISSSNAAFENMTDDLGGNLLLLRCLVLCGRESKARYSCVDLILL